MPKAKIYVASMKMRGDWAPVPVEGAMRVNVTSAQATRSKWRRDFSPMTPVPGGYNGFHCFENYWQAHKVFEELGHTTSSTKRATFLDEWRKFTKGMRRHPSTRGMKPAYAEYGDGVKRTAVDARKNVYVAEYHALMKDSRSLAELRKVHETGAVPALVVYDFDGPRVSGTGENSIEELTVDLLKKKINDTEFPFGHGYVVAAAIAGINPGAYCGDE